jgi:uncharacterized protein DUF3788
VTAPPYLKKTPKPSVEDLEASAGMSRAGTFRRLRPYLVGRPDVVEDLHHAGADLGWGVRYRQKADELCVLYLHPDELFTVMRVPAPIADQALVSEEISSVTKDLLRAAPSAKGPRTVRLKLEDRTLVADFRALVLWKGGGPPPRRRP